MLKIENNKKNNFLLLLLYCSFTYLHCSCMNSARGVEQKKKKEKKKEGKNANVVDMRRDPNGPLMWSIALMNEILELREYP